ncbi:hypothetical protein DYE50_09625 [Treponema ruminis]|uniref:Methyl-accepting chemotaxis protein n=1 Tax=Treponema ruminis TaxID=744515 RepID=A0A7W8G9C3_9SPIR|nr:methyl-accepting chemotaxis protein [Treponema ruminis]MBB5226269.1 methyl-accepting chemotaxis protein [Treponema ruminis]QSI02824.1 hypothetical protein DYE50_09625 [Treponema ruminis]
MNVFKIFLTLIFSTTYLGIFTLRVFHYGFIYERPSAIVFECIPTVSISFFLILGCAIVEYPILTRFESIIKKGRRDKSSITESDVAECMSCYKKFDIAIAAGDAIGFLLGAGSTAIIESIKGIAPFEPLVFLIIELQSVGIGFLCYTLIVFLVKRILMTSQMREIGIQVNENLSRNLNIAIGSCVYISIMNMITVPINLIKNPGEGNFNKYLLYCLIGAVLDGLICFGTYYLIIRKIQKTEKHISSNLLKETQNLVSATKESAETSHNQSTAVKEIVATMQDSTELAGNISEKVKHVTSLAEKSRDAVLSGREVLQKNVNELLEIKNTNRLTIEGIRELNKKINSIWDIVSIINVVADQTKIIAFNAELEAASSGEAGKNFHIVATEIRRLSDNIIDSIKEIKERISEIQKASDSLILDGERGTEQINSGYTGAKSLEKDFESIMQSSDNTAASTHEILEHVSQLSSSSEQIFITLKQIAEGIENFSEFTSSISSSSENVRKIADLL